MTRIEFAAAQEITAQKLNQNIICGSYNAGATINGADLPVPVYMLAADGEAYACIANDSAKINFVGFAITNAVDGNAITIQGSGIVEGFSGLTKGARYYLSDTLGLISTTAGTNKVMVGIAISATEIAINQEAISQDSQYMKLTTDQTIAGIKTFSSIPVLPASNPTTDNQAARKAYVDALVAASSGNVSTGPGTLYYTKRGRFYYRLYIIDVNLQGNSYPLSLYPDTTTAARVATHLGKTLSTYWDLGFYHGGGSNGVPSAQWNGSAWVLSNYPEGSGLGRFIDGILMSD